MYKNINSLTIHKLLTVSLFFLLIACSEVNVPLGKGNLINTSLKTTQLPDGTLEYAVWEPPGYKIGQKLPLIISLHGGGGSQEELESWVPSILEEMAKGDFPAAIWSMPSAGRSFYMNAKDGSADWESVIVDEYIPAVMRQYDITDTNNVVITGVSMGGMGGLRIAFKYPEKFGAVAVLEPAIEAAFNWEALSTSDTFYREDIYTKIFGNPVDPEYWKANHPTAIANAHPRSLDDINIYIEVGDVDNLKLYRGVEFLHRVLFDHGVEHEYRLVRGADHVGSEFMKLRFVNMLGFVNRHFNPIEEGVRSIGLKKLLSATVDDSDFEPDVPLKPHRREHRKDGEL
ncbi:esterase family protein [Gammaproteobacteria bacterium]|nr:esterase family protein [Gammaproteobacteria bacterium]MDA7844147.1 esterase family protein [Gammaproteobacteria bacterium]MDB2581997.1 esterase family protein [Gammaproteobacteria bacterium]